jgi:hypothetical protein
MTTIQAPGGYVTLPLSEDKLGDYEVFFMYRPSGIRR